MTESCKQQTDPINCPTAKELNELDDKFKNDVKCSMLLEYKDGTIRSIGNPPDINPIKTKD